MIVKNDIASPEPLILRKVPSSREATRQDYMSKENGTGQDTRMQPCVRIRDADLYIQHGARYTGVSTVIGILGEGANAILRNISSALTLEPYQSHLMTAKAQMVLDGPAYQGLVTALREFFSLSSNDLQRERCLNALDQVALASLLEELGDPSKMLPQRQEVQVDIIVCKLLAALFGEGATTILYRRKLKDLIFRMHTDRKSALNRDFGCAFRNNARDLLWKVIIFLHERCGRVVSRAEQATSPTQRFDSHQDPSKTEIFRNRRNPSPVKARHIFLKIAENC